MAQFEFKVVVEAPTHEQAKEKLAACMNVMNHVCSQTSDKEFLELAVKIKQKSASSIRAAKKFL